MYYVFFVVHLLIALLMCIVVLLQRSKGNGLAGAFGGVGAGEAMFGSHGVTTFLHKATIYLGAAFMVTSLTLAFMTARRTSHQSAGGATTRGGEIVLPVGGDEVAAPEVPTTDPTATGDAEVGDVVDDIVPAALPTDDSTGESGEAAASSTEETEGGNR